jgi:hypothetical protein
MPSHSSPPACCSPSGSGSRLGAQRLPPTAPPPTRRSRMLIWTLSLAADRRRALRNRRRIAPRAHPARRRPLRLRRRARHPHRDPPHLNRRHLHLPDPPSHPRRRDRARLGTRRVLGAVGFAGSYLGARLQQHLPERSIRRLLGLIACLVAARYIQTGVQQPPARRHTPSRPDCVPRSTVLLMACAPRPQGRRFATRVAHP